MTLLFQYFFSFWTILTDLIICLGKCYGCYVCKMNIFPLLIYKTLIRSFLLITVIVMIIWLYHDIMTILAITIITKLFNTMHFEPLFYLFVL